MTEIMSETPVQKRIRKMRNKAAKKQKQSANKKKVREDRELTLHEAHRWSKFCRRRHEGREKRGYYRFEKVIDNVSFQPLEADHFNIDVEARTWRFPHEPYVPPKENDDRVVDDLIIDLDEASFNMTEAKKYLNTGFRTFSVA